MRYDQYTTLVAFYGSLKKGGRLNPAIESGYGRYLGTAKTVPGYTLYDCGPYPAMVEADPETNPGVWCELYEITDKLLARIDEIEGHPNFYRRSDIQIENVSLLYLPISQTVFEQLDRKVAKSYVYQGDVERLENVGSFYQNQEP